MNRIQSLRNERGRGEKKREEKRGGKNTICGVVVDRGLNPFFSILFNSSCAPDILSISINVSSGFRDWHAGQVGLNDQ